MSRLASFLGAFLLPGFLLCQSGTELPTLLIFSGSDWCLPCIRLEKQVFSTEEFLKFSEGRFKVQKVDFPQTKTLPPNVKERNEKLAERYNPKGIFPKILLIAPTGEVLITLPQEAATTEAFIKSLTPHLQKENTEYRRKALLMGSSFEFTIVHHDADTARQLLQYCVDETTRLENLLSEWIPGSEVSQVNDNAGVKAMEVSPEVYGLTERALRISELTQGAFDITFQGMKIWKFDKEDHAQLPSVSDIKSEFQRVGYQDVELIAPNKIFLKKKSMAIGFGAIGKGFAADHLKQKLIEKGVSAGVINASGDIAAWGTHADGQAWKVGIADPQQPEKLTFGFPFSDEAVATSGNYEKYFLHEGKRYAHIINPKTGYPVTDKKSVTVISPSAELSDALATALFVMDPETGLHLVEQLPQVRCLIVDADDQVYTSKNLTLAEQ